LILYKKSKYKKNKIKKLTFVDADHVLKL
jgi:hypothetical protein